jgi:hypothetical protein
VRDLAAAPGLQEGIIEASGLTSARNAPELDATRLLFFVQSIECRIATTINGDLIGPN